MYEKADEFGRRVAYTITMVPKSFCGVRKCVQKDKFVRREDRKRLAEFKQYTFTYIYNPSARITS